MTSAALRQLDLVPMSECHIDSMLAIERDIASFPWTRGNFADSIASGYSAWGCRADGEWVGYYILMLAVDEAHLLNIGVSARCQRMGFGAALLRHSAGNARQAGASSLLLEVRRSNEKARGLYRSFGFRQIGVRKGYYPAENGREDALVLCLPLDGAGR